MNKHMFLWFFKCVFSWKDSFNGKMPVSKTDVGGSSPSPSDFNTFLVILHSSHS